MQDFFKLIGEINFVLLIVFVVLKLIGVIAWSWWAVTAPFWVPLLIAVFFVLLLAAAIHGTDEARR